MRASPLIHCTALICVGIRSSNGGLTEGKTGQQSTPDLTRRRSTHVALCASFQCGPELNAIAGLALRSFRHRYLDPLADVGFAERLTIQRAVAQDGVRDAVWSLQARDPACLREQSANREIDNDQRQRGGWVVRLRSELSSAEPDLQSKSFSRR